MQKPGRQYRQIWELLMLVVLGVNHSVIHDFLFRNHTTYHKAFTTIEQLSKSLSLMASPLFIEKFKLNWAILRWKRVIGYVPIRRMNRPSLPKSAYFSKELEQLDMILLWNTKE